MNTLNYFVIMSVAQGSKLDMNGKGQLLGIAEEGYFASSAWIKGYEEYSRIIGSSFGIITGEDCLTYKEDKSKMSRPTIGQLFELLPKCCSSFQELAYDIIEDAKNEAELNALETQ